jgi:hypothetical protein
MHRLLARAQPSFDCVLLIESGPRKVTEQFLPFLYEIKGAARVDVLTCYNTPPKAFDFDRGVVYSVNDPEVRRDRAAFVRKLSSGPYTVLALMLTGLPIMTKWKWTLAFRSSARLIAVNEEAKYFGLEIWNHRSMARMLLQRLNPFADYTRDSLAAMLIRFLLGLFIAPFTVGYLLLYTGFVHLRRALRDRKPLAS